jgi:hypothetical protein
MRFMVLNEQLEARVVELCDPLRIVEGRVLDRIVDSNGIEHFFTKQGYYDGWGAEVQRTAPTKQEKEQ